jgi:hypothetical protein
MCDNIQARLTQLVEYLTFNQQSEGSTPSSRLFVNLMKADICSKISFKVDICRVMIQRFVVRNQAKKL